MPADTWERDMRGKGLKAFAFSTAMGIAALPALAQAQPPAPPKTGYKAPLAADGHPDLQGVWTSATVTRLERNPKYGPNLTLTDAEVRKIEAKTKAQIDLG